MTTTVFAKTLRDQRRGLIGWGLGTAVTVMVMSAIWPSFSDMDIDSLLDQYPDAMKDVFNISAMTTGTGYLNAELFSIMLPAIFIIFAVSRGARLLAGEEEDGTLDVLASMPLSRRDLLLEKAAALTAAIAVLAAVLLVSTWVSGAVFGLDIPLRYAVNGTIAMFLIGLEFGLVALGLGAATGRRGLAIGVSAGLAGGTYLLYLAAQLIDTLRPLRILSPFYQAIADGPMGPTLPPITAAMLAVGLIALSVSVQVFNRRDLAL